MRRMVVAGIVLACAAFIAGGALRGQRQAGIEAAPVKEAAPVEVINFPAVQSVAGSVEVANLPLDADGNVRVAGGTERPPFKLIRIFDPTVFPPAQTYARVGPFDVAGWKRATVFINHPAGPPNIGNNSATVEYGTSGVFIRATDVGLNDQVDASTTDVVMPELRLSILTTTGDTYEGWLYLSN